MKKLLLTLAGIACLAFNASAILFEGTFTGTATVVNSSEYGFNNPGDMLTGTYSYESASVDGNFSPDSGNLMVTINFPDGTTINETDADDFGNDPRLWVDAGGAVSFFNFIYNPPGDSLQFLLTEFGSEFSINIGIDGSIEVSGDLSFSDPQSGEVPDASSSAILLGLACLGLWAVRRPQMAA